MTIKKAEVPDRRVFQFQPPGDWKPVTLVNLMDGGPLCVGRVYDWKKGDVVTGLYWIYVKKCGGHVGPYFADIHLAFKAMRKLVKRFGIPFWEQPLSWLQRQSEAHAWIDKNIGKIEDLIGGQWAKPDEDKEGT